VGFDNQKVMVDSSSMGLLFHCCILFLAYHALLPLRNLFIVLLFFPLHSTSTYFIFYLQLLIMTEFSKEEYQTAKVDLIAQFAKPVAVYCL
jgi:hypothetical protein